MNNKEPADSTERVLQQYNIDDVYILKPWDNSDNKCDCKFWSNEDGDWLHGHNPDCFMCSGLGYERVCEHCLDNPQYKLESDGSYYCFDCIGRHLHPHLILTDNDPISERQIIAALKKSA